MSRILVLTAAAVCLVLTSTAGRAEPRARCENLMTFLRRFPSFQAATALRRMDVERHRNRYLACIQAGEPALYVALRWDPLSRVKQDRIRQAVASAQMARVEGQGGLDVGDILPPSTPLQGLPEDMLDQVPEVTGYRFVLDGEVILIVEPASRLVVQKIARRPG